MKRLITINYNQQSALEYAIKVLKEQREQLEEKYSPTALTRIAGYMELRTAIRYLAELERKWAEEAQ